jgi:hypothetical protein
MRGPNRPRLGFEAKWAVPSLTSTLCSRIAKRCRGVALAGVERGYGSHMGLTEEIEPRDAKP